MASKQPYAWHDHYPASDVVHVNVVSRNGNRIFHNHDYAEISLTTAGYGRFRSEQLNREIKRGVMIVVPPGVDHTYTNCRNAEILFCSVRPEFVESLSILMRTQPRTWAEFGLGQAIRTPHIFASEVDEHLISRCEETLLEMHQSHRSRGLKSRLARLGGLFSFLGLALSQQSSTNTAAKGDTESQLSPLTVRTLAILRGDLSKSWTMTSLSEFLNNVHPVHLCRVFKNDMDMTPMAYLRYLRCQHSAFLLSTTDLPVSEIAFRVGWDDANLFSRRFKVHFETTPTEYRAAHAVNGRSV